MLHSYVQQTKLKAAMHGNVGPGKTLWVAATPERSEKKRALISVSDKRSLDKLARGLIGGPYHLLRKCLKIKVIMPQCNPYVNLTGDAIHEGLCTAVRLTRF